MKIVKVNYVDVDKNTVFLKNVKKIGSYEDIENDLLSCGVNKKIVLSAIREYRDGISMSLCAGYPGIILNGLNEKIVKRLMSCKNISRYSFSGCIVDFGMSISRKNFLIILKLMKEAGNRYVKIKNKYSNLGFKSKTVLI
jgi:hypothetical protein